MKIEDLHLPTQSEPVDGKDFDLDKWRSENHIDYLKLIPILNTAPIEGKDLVFQLIYQGVHLSVPDVLYKYYSLTDDEQLNNKKLQTLWDCKIYMSKLSDFNDPFDGRAFYYNEQRISTHKDLAQFKHEAINKFSSNVRIASLTANGINSMPMWAHYANNHTGFCVAYDMRQNNLLSCSTFPVQYTDECLDITSFVDQYVDYLFREFEAQFNKKTIYIADKSLVDIALLLINLKHQSWSYEKEFRCATASDTAGMPYTPAKPKEIYAGAKCSPKNFEYLSKIANELVVPIHQMGFNEYSPQFNLAII